MRVKAMRGVCVGVEDNLKEGEVRDLDPGTADYLKNIGAAVDAPEEEVAGVPAAEAKPAPEEAAAAAGGEASAAVGDEPAA